MKFHLFFIVFVLIINQCLTSKIINRLKRAAYELPAGTQELLGFEVRKTFKCESDGYFADVDNQCKIFHVCHTQKAPGRKAETTQNSMVCGLMQVFDQSKLSCNHESEAIPCDASPDFFYLNERIGDPTAKFLTDADIDRAKNARPDYKAKK